MSVLYRLKSLLTVHHVLNFLLASSFLVCKYTPVVCEATFPEPDPCELSDYETRLLFFAAVVIWAKTKKTGERSVLPYISTAFTYMKLLNLVLWFYSDPVKGIIYLLLATVTYLWFPEPAIASGEEKVTYYSYDELEETLSQQRNTVFLICFFAAWYPSSVKFADIFSRLSATYALDNLAFGKVDVTRHPRAADKYHISTSSFSRQLPTVILFDGGDAVNRRPGFDHKQRLIPFLFTEENVIAAFDLNNVYRKCKDELPRFKKLEAKKEK